MKILIALSLLLSSIAFASPPLDFNILRDFKDTIRLEENPIPDEADSIKKLDDGTIRLYRDKREDPKEIEWTEVA